MTHGETPQFKEAQTGEQQLNEGNKDLTQEHVNAFQEGEQIAHKARDSGDEEQRQSGEEAEKLIEDSLVLSLDESELKTVAENALKQYKGLNEADSINLFTKQAMDGVESIINSDDELKTLPDDIKKDLYSSMREQFGSEIKSYYEEWGKMVKEVGKKYGLDSNSTEEDAKKVGLEKIIRDIEIGQQNLDHSLKEKMGLLANKILSDLKGKYGKKYE